MLGGKFGLLPFELAALVVELALFGFAFRALLGFDPLAFGAILSFLLAACGLGNALAFGCCGAFRLRLPLDLCSKVCKPLRFDSIFLCDSLTLDTIGFGLARGFCCGLLMRLLRGEHFPQFLDRGELR
ncbi:MAG TPA: hypothetical protein VF447_03300, partial [Terriglobales bacterium]